MNILQCDHLSRSYGSGEERVLAVDGVSFAVEQGSFTAITGPSGSGKSTLLHLLGGLDRPSAGSVRFRDWEIYDLKDDQLAILRRRQFGFVFQSYNLVRELTGYENILLPLMLDKRKPDEAYLDRLIDILGIRQRLNHLPSALSGGQQQRFAIARALANKPEILFADEPTGNLDGQTGRLVMDLLRSLNRELGGTLVLVTHDLGVAEQAERILHLTDGKILRDSGGTRP